MITFYDIKSGADTKKVLLKDLQSLWDRAIKQFTISPEKEPSGTEFFLGTGEEALTALFKAMVATDVVVLRLPEKLVDVSARRLRDFVRSCFTKDTDASLDEQIAAAAIYLPVLDELGLMLDSAAIFLHLTGKVDKLGESGNPTSVASVMTSEGLTIVANESDLTHDKSRKIDDSVGKLVEASLKRGETAPTLAKVTPPTEGGYRAYSAYAKLLKLWSKNVANPKLNAKFNFGALAEHYLKLAKTKQIHAELRLIDLLVARALSPPPMGLLYIGSSLLCCSDCARAIEFFNNHVSHEEGLGIRVITRGAHPGCYKDSWELPYFVAKYKDAFLEANPGFMTRASNDEAAVFSRKV